VDGGDYQERYPSYDDTSGQAEATPPAGAKRVGAPRYKTPCQQSQGHDESDLCAQWRAANAAKQAAKWALFQFLLSIFGVIGLVITLWYNKRAIEIALEGGEDTERALVIAERNAEAATTAAEAGKRSVAVAAETLEHSREVSDLELRPWITITVRLASPIFIDEQAMKFSVLITLQNVGKSVAQQVWVTPEAVSSPSAERAQAFFAERRRADIRPGLNNLLNPGEAVVGNHFVMILREDFNTNVPEFVIPGLLVSACYMGLKGDKVMQTGRTFAMHRHGPQGQAMAFENRPGETPMAGASIYPSPLGGDYAA
jgi:hypothetical protein